MKKHADSRSIRVAQGTAAEMMKLGMINLIKQLTEKLPDAKMLLQIHDELLISVPEHEQEHAKKIIKQTLEHVVDWNVPLIVDIRSGKDWQETTK